MNSLGNEIMIQKSKSTNDIEKYLDLTVEKILKLHIEPEVSALLKAQGFIVNEDPRVFTNTILLSCILSDIGYQRSHYIRNDNIHKIEEICEKRKINFKQVLEISSYAEQIAKLLETKLESI